MSAKMYDSLVRGYWIQAPYQSQTQIPLISFGRMEAPNMINVQYGPLIVWPRQPLNYTAQFEGSKLPKAFKLLMINCEEALW